MRRAGVRPRVRRSVIAEAAMSAGAVLTLVGVLVAMDDRVRNLIAFRGVPGRPPDMVEAGNRAHEFALLVLDVARDQTLDHAPLVIFVLAAAVLTVVMLRT